MSETNNHTISNANVKLTGYSRFREDLTRSKGGVCCYTKQDAVRRLNLVEDNIQLIRVEVKIDSKLILIGNCDRNQEMNSDEKKVFFDNGQ